MEFKKLSSQQKEKFYEQLEINPQKELQNELNRTAELEYEIVTQYGIEGAEIVLYDDDSPELYLLGDFPAECPWFELNDKGTVGFVKSVFKAIKNQAPDFVEAMKDRCLFVFAEKGESGWWINYVINIKLADGRDYFRVFAGAEPNLDPEPNDNLDKYGWKIPEDLQRFYAIHDGFGDADAQNILSTAELRVLAEEMDPVCKEQDLFPEGYKFSNLLEFCSDGEGNAQCFWRKKVKEQNPITVDWDHETWELSYKKEFFSFLNTSFSALDEEEY